MAPLNPSLVPTTFVVFGATGDLFRNKLLSAIFQLSSSALPTWHLVACGRREYSTEAFRNEIRDLLHGETDAVNNFLSRISYHRGLFDDPNTYTALGERLSAIDQELEVCSNKLFYLAVPPSLYETILEQISRSGLSVPCSDSEGWTRILIEKPFGKDLESGRKLDARLGSLFREEQIFRIDHYLAKETVQNIVAFRFGNALFEPVWNRDSIESVSIRLWEKGGIGKRGNFYSDTGALRDVGQNHLLQMLALVAMEAPRNMSADAVRGSRAEVLSRLIPFEAKDLSASVRAQYEGFTEDAGEGTETETFFRIPAYLDLPRWKGVPFYLESGKAMKESLAEISVTFKPPALNPTAHNIVTMRIQPNEGIAVKFFAKKPGLTYELEPRELSFIYDSKHDELSDAYEKVLFDCIRGDQTLFTSTEEVLAAWKFISPILELWKKIPLVTYQRGSEGPNYK